MKRTIAILLAAVMVLSLCACGGGNKAPAEPELSEEAKALGAAAEVVKITNSGEIDWVYIDGHDNFPSPETLKDVTLSSKDGKIYIYHLPEDADSDTATSYFQAYLLLLTGSGYTWEQEKDNNTMFQVKEGSSLIAFVGYAMDDGAYAILAGFI